MIGSIEREARVAVLDPPAEHLLVQTDPDDRSVLELIEATRQLGLMVEYAELGTPLDGAILWLRIQVDLPCVISRKVPLEMRLRKSERSGRQGLHSVDLVRPDTRQVLGRMENETYVISCERYDAMRSK
jgi:hypothetical protein